eukprot:2278703-Rhodomonas_salina.1
MSGCAALCVHMRGGLTGSMRITVFPLVGVLLALSAQGFSAPGLHVNVKGPIFKRNKAAWTWKLRSSRRLPIRPASGSPIGNSPMK